MSDEGFPVVFGICLDAEALWTNKVPVGSHRPVLFSHGRYALHEGLEPLLALLSTHGIRASFFVPGITADNYPDALRRIQDHGHELGSHGMHHVTPTGMERSEERRELVEGIEAVARAVGQRPSRGGRPHGRSPNPPSGFSPKRGSRFRRTFRIARARICTRRSAARFRSWNCPCTGTSRMHPISSTAVFPGG